jgi:hypothetical protein
VPTALDDVPLHLAAGRRRAREKVLHRGLLVADLHDIILIAMESPDGHATQLTAVLAPGAPRLRWVARIARHQERRGDR